VVWCPSFQSRLRADGVREYRVGHELVDEFLEFASGRARPSTVRAYAHDLRASADRGQIRHPAVPPVDQLGGEQERDGQGQLGQAVNTLAVGVAAQLAVI